MNIITADILINIKNLYISNENELEEIKNKINEFIINNFKINKNIEYESKIYFEDYTTCFKDKYGSKYWYNKDKKRHREGDQPAVILSDGRKEWWINQKIHREGDQPAVILSDGTQFWYNEGDYHREGDNPAIIFANGNKHWYKYGKCHRDNDLPAAIFSNGDQCWYQYGKLHRDDDKPAVIYADGEEEFWVNGIKIK